MKNLIKLFAPFFLASSLFAHSNALPHTHEGSHTNWLPAMVCLLALAAVVGFTLSFRKARKSR
ncbi:hypothetical protein [Pelagicoccus sp. SDUM812003]|uniref:hypothetical protein n=1 Tax=Pelagicoccus sp. SDUM812003 TaxID=3041267 RepID=UPI00280E5B22|nr:hypothetical protein [Pelagicoccus sp. SDUM812003]MDQ8202683.1 hypothetical protein [Pelagicoccus sp. SDUM812003]